MGVVLQLGAPCVKDRHKADKGCSEESPVAGEFFEGSDGRGKQGGISEALVAADYVLERLREGDSEEEVVAGKELALLPGKPLGGLVLLAGRTVTVSAGAGDGMGGAAPVTAVKGCTVSATSAVADCPYDLAVHPGDALAVTLDVFGPVFAEYFLYCAHESIPCMSCATRLWESVWARVVTWR